MTQIMIEFGSTRLGPVRGAIETALADVGYTIEVLTATKTHDLEYQRVETDLETACGELAKGTLSSVRLRSDGAEVAWALLFGPTFGSDRARPWTGVVEVRHSRWQAIFDRIVSLGEVDFLVVSLEETLDLAAGAISAGRFPWNDARLIKAALPTNPGPRREWVMRGGPASEGPKAGAR